MILWPYHDLSPDDRYFEAANMLAVKGIMPGLEDSLDFEAWRPMTRSEMYLALLAARLPFTAGRNEGKKPLTGRDLYDALREAGKKPSEGLARSEAVLYRYELAMHLWHVLKPGSLR